MDQYINKMGVTFRLPVRVESLEVFTLMVKQAIPAFYRAKQKCPKVLAINSVDLLALGGEKVIKPIEDKTGLHLRGTDDPKVVPLNKFALDVLIR